MSPLVSIVTPTMPAREDLLLKRCMPSVENLNWPDVQHVIVSDPNAVLYDTLTDPMGYRPSCEKRVRHWSPVDVRFVELNGSWRTPMTERSIGAVPWHVGSLLALGDFVGFLGDDDELLPDHARRHVEAMEETGADFTISVIDFRVDGQHRQNIGDALAHGRLDATGIMCRASALQVANWTANGVDAADWRLVEDWMRAGLRGHLLGGEPTGIHHDGWMAR